MTTKRDKRHEIVSNITAEVSKVVVGKEDIKELLLVALLSQGHILIEGLPGTAKTTLASTFARVIGGEFKRIQGTPDILPADILGFYHYRPDGSSSFMPGPIFANVVLADELNRTTPRTQAALLEAMQERQVTIERETHPLGQPFIVIASQIPYGSAGTSILSEVQMDRFMFRLWSGFPGREEEGKILRDIDEISEPNISPVATSNDIIQLQQEVKKVYIADSIRAYIIDILSSLRCHQDLSLGPSPRAGIALFRGSRTLAFIQGRDFVIPDDVKRLLMPVLSHRLRITAEAEMENITPEAIINRVAVEVPVPKEGAMGGVEETEEATSQDREDIEVPTAVTEADSGVSGLSQETVIESPLPAETEETPGEVQHISDRDEKALTELGKPISKMISDWKWIIVICALVIGTVMVCVGLLSVR